MSRNRQSIHPRVVKGRTKHKEGQQPHEVPTRNVTARKIKARRRATWSDTRTARPAPPTSTNSSTDKENTLEITIRRGLVLLGHDDPGGRRHNDLRLRGDEPKPAPDWYAAW